ncbi:MAG TPA: MXAN_5187 C-terminal domain-containing protein [Dongiaceae bacterium]|nr:MXAN_5187 C-terminal domain-containing protein [Dongiaceae bacterium]
MTTEEELKAIDYEIKRLKVQYDLYFSGALARPPHDQRDALGRQLKRFQGVSLTNMSERFIYNAVVNKFNTFQELWIKMTRIKEEGVRMHPLAVRAAMRKAQMDKASGKVTAPAATSSPGKAAPATAGATPTAAAAPASAPAAAAAKPGTPARSPDAGAWRLRPAGGDDPTLRGLYESFLAARKVAGENRPLGFDAFAREVSRHMAALKEKSDCEAVEFKIYSRDNKVTLKARPAGKG